MFQHPCFKAFVQSIQGITDECISTERSEIHMKAGNGSVPIPFVCTGHVHTRILTFPVASWQCTHVPTFLTHTEHETGCVCVCVCVQKRGECWSRNTQSWMYTSPDTRIFPSVCVVPVTVNMSDLPVSLRPTLSAAETIARS